jgi:hypothetical protein
MDNYSNIDLLNINNNFNNNINNNINININHNNTNNRLRYFNQIANKTI